MSEKEATDFTTDVEFKGREYNVTVSTANEQLTISVKDSETDECWINSFSPSGIAIVLLFTI